MIKRSINKINAENIVDNERMADDGNYGKIVVGVLSFLCSRYFQQTLTLIHVSLVSQRLLILLIP